MSNQLQVLQYSIPFFFETTGEGSFFSMLFFLDVVLVAGAVTILPRRCLTLIASKGLASGDKIPAVDTAASEVEEAKRNKNI